MNKMNEPKNKKPFVGGQALIEGVMFRSPHVYGMAVRDPQGDIHIEGRRKTALTSRFPFSLPFIRGVAALWESLSLGIDVLTRSADIAVPEDEEKKAKRKKRPLFEKFKQALTLIVSFGLGIGLFVGIPYLITHFVLDARLGIGETNPLFHVADGLLRLTMFLLYINVISLMKDVRRMFAYHGAEHKVINCYEGGAEPTIETARNSTRFHPRCGTSFIVILLLVLIVIHSIAFLFIPEQFSYILKLAIRIALLIPIAGVSYELIRLGSKFPDSKVINFFLLPGLATQFFTTREPDDDMLQVSLASFNRVMELERDPKLPDDTPENEEEGKTEEGPRE
ncbi:MAG: DUF1385 domain-containing protein [Candidatus Dadabacteria bacterium]|nr:DUF1385 domain-containing protein [Candidatus Dadabacteria bacterium]